MQTIKRTRLIDPPFGGPQSNQFPSQPFEYCTTDLVTIPRCSCAVISRAIAFDTNKIIAWSIRMDDPQVDSESRYTNLWHYLPALSPQSLGNRFFKWRVIATYGSLHRFGKRPWPTLSEFNKVFQVAHCSSISTVQIDH